MRRVFLGILLSFVFSHLTTNQVSAQTRTTPLIIDHSSIALFDQIPDNYINAASNMGLMFRHASVGQNILEGLQCLAGERANVDRCAQIQNPVYDYHHWSFQNRGNPSWAEKVHDFVVQSQMQINQHDVFMFKYCFLDYTCTNPQDRFNQLLNGLDNQYGMQDLYQWLSVNGYQDKLVVWWTVPTYMWHGQACAEEVNNLIRQHVRDNNLILVDIADIESHDPTGNPVTDASGLEITYGPYCGEYTLPCRLSCHLDWPKSGPDCDGNILSSAPDGGKIRVAKAVWVLMAQLAGWHPETPPPPTYDFADLWLRLLAFGTNNQSLNLVGTSPLINIFDLNYIIRFL